MPIIPQFRGSFDILLSQDPLYKTQITEDSAKSLSGLFFWRQKLGYTYNNLYKYSLLLLYIPSSSSTLFSASDALSI